MYAIRSYYENNIHRFEKTSNFFVINTKKIDTENPYNGLKIIKIMFKMAIKKYTFIMPSFMIFTPKLVEFYP